MFALQSFISHFIIGDADGNTALSSAQAHQPLPSGVVNKFVGYLGDAHKKDPIELTSKLRESPALLQADEKVELAFKGGRDLFLITTKRIISINRKGITGKSTDYRSFPLMYNKAFRIETEGHLLNGAEVKIIQTMMILNRSSREVIMKVCGKFTSYYLKKCSIIHKTR